RETAAVSGRARPRLGAMRAGPENRPKLFSTSLAGASGGGARCEKACNPRLGNLAHGRVLRTDTACGTGAPEPYCAYAEAADRSCEPPACGRCSSARAALAHPPAAMADSPFRRPRTWWQSAQNALRETIRLDLEAAFYFTHLILVFKSPRPAAMVLERSQDFGKTWRPYKYFAANCSATFGLQDDVAQKGAACTSRYSSPFPCTGGEVIYRALSPPYAAEDPYSAEAQKQLKITNLRVQLLKRQGCPCRTEGLQAKPPQLLHFAVYDFIVKGSCFCNGHADHCVPVAGFRPVKAAGVHGKCMCKHNTAGSHCQHCAPLYNDQPWQAADACKCNGHADTCHFDMDAWLASGNRSGGICDNCQHNTEGQHCQRCKLGFYRDLRKPFSCQNFLCKSCRCLEGPKGSGAAPPGLGSSTASPSLQNQIPTEVLGCIAAIQSPSQRQGCQQDACVYNLQNHRMVEVKRDLWILSSPTICSSRVI
uniref:Netrin 4 n=1 Tax=Apteryx owenii TaxID=8824 RepID=A0A8B9PHC8_APTOW